MAKNKSQYQLLSAAFERAQSDIEDAARAASDAEHEMNKLYNLIEAMDDFGSPVIKEAVAMAMPMLIAKYGHASQEVRDAELFVAAAE